MTITQSQLAKASSVLQDRKGLRSRVFWSLLTNILFAVGLPPANAQIFDSLDAYPPRFHLDSSDCDASIISHKHLPDGGIDGRACEIISLSAATGTEILLAYPVEPMLPVDALTANLAVMGARDGARIGFRVRFPHLRSRETRRAESVVVYGASYEHPGEFASIGVGMIEKPLRIKSMALRSEYGVNADLRDPYVDAVIINSYSGEGVSSLRIDDLRIEGIITLSEVAAATGRSPMSKSTNGGQTIASHRPTSQSNKANSRPLVTQLALQRQNAFPLGKVTRILQYNGEPLSWVRSLGFDAVLLSSPPDAAILGEAIRARLSIYAPAPSSPNPGIEAMLGPVAGWYVGSKKPLDTSGLEEAARTTRWLRSLPTSWQRPLVAAPSESFSQYVPMLDAAVYDLPIRARGVTAIEQSSQVSQFTRVVANRVQTAIGVRSMPCESALVQTESIADSIGAPRPNGFRWHSMWAQAMRGLQASPSAILYRSTRSLASGSEMDSSRSMALSYCNRMIAMLEPWLAGAQLTLPMPVSPTEYHCTRLSKDDTDVVILTSDRCRGSELLAGDGQSIEVALSPADVNKTIWRLTHFSAERITPEASPNGLKLSIVSPDVVEVLVVSSDPATGGRLSQSAQRFAKQASLDRWQLASDLVRRTRDQWTTVVASRISTSPLPRDMIDVAGRTLADAEPLYRAGDVDASLRMARRADAWAMRSMWQLTEVLMPDWPRMTSCPPIDCGAPEVQTLWFPLMHEQGWSRNYMSTGSLDTKDILSDKRWSFGKRLEDRANTEVILASRDTYSGPGALLARSTSIAEDPLLGGYEGTVAQIRSPSIRVSSGSAIRIDALVKTIGFGGDHQGILVYDSIGGQEMGVLVRGRPNWTPVRLYRQTLTDSDVSVMFEVIGGGEATIDEVTLRVWQPSNTPDQRMPFRPIDR